MPVLRVVLLLIGDALVVLSALASLTAYTSGDPSGLQYMFLDPAAGLALVAVLVGGLLAVLSPRRPLVWANLALAVAALLLALLPQATGLGYNGAALDKPGGAVAVGLLLLAAAVVVRGLAPPAAERWR